MQRTFQPTGRGSCGGVWRRGLLSDTTASTALEYSLIMAAIAIPMYGVFRIALQALTGYYQMLTFINCWPFP